MDRQIGRFTTRNSDCEVWQGKSEISIGLAMRKGRLKLLVVGRNYGPQAEFLLRWRNLSSAVKVFQLIKSGSPR